MTDRDLLKQALEALEWCRGEDLAWVNEPEFFTEAITALRERLAQPEQEPCREWVGLTDDELEMLELKHAPPVHPEFVQDDDWWEFARAIEAKLKEKNNAD